MMIKAIIAVLLVAAVAVQATHQTAVKADEDIVSMLSKVYDASLEYSAYYIQAANWTLHYYEEHKQNFQDTYTSIWVSFAQSLNNVFVEEVLDELVEESDGEVKAFIECFKNEQDSVNAALNITVRDIAECVYTEVDLALPYWKGILDNEIEIHDKVQAQIDNLKRCSKSELECLEDFIQEGHSILMYFVDFLIDNSVDWLFNIFQIIEDLWNCQYFLKHNVKNSTRRILTQTYNCIKSN